MILGTSIRLHSNARALKQRRRWSADAPRPQVPVVPQFGVVARPAAFPPRSQSVQRFGRTS